MAEALLHYGDPHLLPNAWAYKPQISGDAFFALNYVVDLCVQKNAHLVIPGDLFDTRNPPSIAVDKFSNAVKFLRKNNLNVYTLQGNHDKVSPEFPRWGAVCGAVEFDKKLIEVDGFSFTGLDFRHENDLQNELAQIPPVDILFLHQYIDLFDTLGANLKADWIPEHVKCVGLNDVHTQWQSYDSKGRYFYYPGNSYVQTITDKTEKFCTLLTKLKTSSKIGSRLKIDFLPIPSRPLRTFKLLTETDYDDFLIKLKTITHPDTDIPEIIRKPIIVIFYTQDFYSRLKELEKSLQEYCHLFIKPHIDKTLTHGCEQDSVNSLEKSSDAAILEKYVDPISNPNLYEFLLNAIRVSDVDNYLENFKERSKCHIS